MRTESKKILDFFEIPGRLLRNTQEKPPKPAAEEKSLPRPPVEAGKERGFSQNA